MAGSDLCCRVFLRGDAWFGAFIAKLHGFARVGVENLLCGVVLILAWPGRLC